MKSRNEIVEISFEFALEVIEYAELLEQKNKHVVARQILKAGTAIGANVREAQKAESKADFIHKLKVADKEAEETDYWLSLCIKSKNYPDPNQKMLDDLGSIIKLLNKIIATCKRSRS